MTNLNLASPINDLGYGYSGFYLTKYLLRNEVKVSLFPIGPVHVDSQDGGKYINEAITNSKSYDNKAPSLRIYHQFDLAQHIGHGLHIGFPIFELDRFSKVENHHLNSQDMIYVCSRWAQEVVIHNTNHTDNTTVVIPLGVDQHILSAVNETIVERKPGTECVFLNVGKWEVRKGHDVLHEAFNNAFGPSDPVELWMMCDNPFYKKEEQAHWEELYMNSPLGKAGKIRIIHRAKAHADVLSIMAKADVGIWPTRAEGWNLELLEMMALGKQVIATDYSAHTEFCTKENCHLIPIDRLCPAYDGKWFFGQGSWADLSSTTLDYLSETVRQIYKSGKFAEANHDGILTGRKFSWDNSAKKIASLLT